MINKSNHPFHIVDASPWPLLISVATLSLVASLVEFIHKKTFFSLILSFLFIFIIRFQWWRDVARERTFQGLHTYSIVRNLKWGIILFILSEILFFISFFWSFFHFSLTPNIELGSSWPPTGVNTFNYLGVPFLNTLILLSSGITVTWSHKALDSNKPHKASNSLITTVVLGFYFTLIQAIEYAESSYSIPDSSFGSAFFVATGFHGIHVIIGRIFLVVTLIRCVKGNFPYNHYFGFEAASWYWHFVDVVWLFLFCSIYWWASN
jgi:cytochrome c oxidase subunit 3